MSKHHPLIGLVGPAGAGKDTVAKLLITHHEFVQVAFADSLREFVRATNPVWALTEQALGYEHAKRNTIGFRETLIQVGEAARALIHPDVWISAMERTATSLREAHPVVVSDVRHQNEAAWVRAQGGVMAAVYRPGTEPEDETMRTLMDHAEFIVPNVGGQSELKGCADTLARLARPLDTL